MKKKSVPFDKLPFQKLFRDYISQSPNILQFYEYEPYSEDSFKQRIQNLNFKGNRKQSVELLNYFNSEFDAPTKTFQSIEKLKSENSLAVVTGQQVTLFGGPLFTIYKTLQAIILAKKIENNYKIPTVPVFWMADEDHDFAEVQSIKISGGKKSVNYQIQGNDEIAITSSEIKLDNQIEKLISNLKSDLLETEFSDELWEKISHCYKSGTTLGEAFGKWMLHLFAKHGLILAGSNHTAIKKSLRDPIIKAVSEVDDLYNTLEKSSQKLEKAGYHRQVHLQKSNLFWLDENRNRLKLKKENGRWVADGSNKSWSTDDLVRDIDNSPEQFSPNVFLRPILQDHLLPNVATIAGPGEVAYYSQMKEFYQSFGIHMPIISPRISATLMESNIDRIFEKLPFRVEDYSNRIEDLESEFVEKADTPDIESIFNSWKKQSEQILESNKPAIKEIDPTLVNSAEKANAIFSGELDKLKGKVYRSVKEQEKVQINRIKKIQENLFPNGSLQEREFAFIYYMNKYGLDIWDKLLKELQSDDTKTHKVICL